MGLELKVSAGDVKSLFIRDKELLMVALRHKDPSIDGKEYSPNLYANPLTIAGYLMFPGIPEYLGNAVGFDKGLYQSRIMTTADTWLILVKSLEGKQTNDLDTLIGQHVSQLKWFEGLYTQLSGLNTAELPNEVAGSIDRGINGLRMLITRSNMMYDPRTRARFLQHVHEGVVEETYEQRLLRRGGWFVQLGEAVGSVIAKVSAYFRPQSR